MPTRLIDFRGIKDKGLGPVCDTPSAVKATVL